MKIAKKPKVKERSPAEIVADAAKALEAILKEQLRNDNRQLEIVVKFKNKEAILFYKTRIGLIEKLLKKL